jgi:hypothetical protein
VKLQRFTLDAGSLGGRIDILRPLPSETREGDTLIIDPWGELAPLRAHPEFASLIPIVTGEAMSHALHGYMRPLMEQIGVEPKYQLIQIPAPHDQCSLAEAGCVMFDQRRCHPRSKKLPECWAPVSEEAARRAMATVTLAWAEGRYVVVVEGDEFVVGGVGV